MLESMKKASERERRLLQKLEATKSDLAREQKKVKEAARKLDTRRKVVLGGALLAAVEKGTIPASGVRDLVTEFVSERDKVLFEGGPFAMPGISVSGATLPSPDRQE